MILLTEITENMKTLTNRLAAIMLAAVAAGASFAAGDDYNYEIIDKPEYPTTDLFVASINAADEKLDRSGQTDCTAAIQALLDRLAGVTNPDKNQDQGAGNRGAVENLAGGVLYLPEGKYRVDGQIVIPRGVTLRGDWRKPVKGQPVAGTVIMAYGNPGTDDELKALFTMQPSTQICNLSIYYPEQDPGNVTKYPPAVVYGQKGYFGNDYCNVRNVTFVNPYIGIALSLYNGGGCPNVFGIYGTPLYAGVVVDNIADVGRFDTMDFSPAYWAGAAIGKEYSETEIKNYTYNNSKGFIMRRNDWSYACNYTCAGYHTAFYTEWTPMNRQDGTAMDSGQRGRPNGHNYGFNISDCQYALDITASANSGIMFTRINVSDCKEGIRIGSSTQGAVHLCGCNIEATDVAAEVIEKASAPLVLNECVLDGNVDVLGGQFMADGSTFNGDVNIVETARAVLTGNTFKGEFDNKSFYKCVVSETKSFAGNLPEFKQEWMEVPVTKPAKPDLFIVTDYGAEPIQTNTKVNPDGLSSAKDNSPFIQKALDEAAANGGGIVYLPPGHYRMDGTLTIPAGVELKGSSDIASVPRGQGATFEVFAGKGNKDGTPFITMEEKSGVRGITINYPEQTDPTKVQEYPYAVRGNADVYIVNLGLRATYKGVDLFTNKCDNHYVDYISGHCFLNVIRIGGGSDGGIVSNIQCNTIAFSCGCETKFGCWQNSPPTKDHINNAYTFGQNKENLEFLIVGDCTNQVLYDNFLFGCNTGILFQDDGNGGATGVGMGNAVDGAVYTLVFNGLKGEFPLINTQMVASPHEEKPNDGEALLPGSERIPACFVTTGPDFKGTATVYSSNNWGNAECFARVNGGILNLVQGHMVTAGSQCTADVAEGARLHIANTFFFSMNKMVETPKVEEAHVSVAGSIVTPKGSEEGDFASYTDNLKMGWELRDNSVFQSFGDWKASASVRDDLAFQAIDGKQDVRWATYGDQAPGQWFDLKNVGGEYEPMSGLLLDSSAFGTKDGPAGYTVDVCSGGENGEWNTVAEGTNGVGMLLIMFDEVPDVSEVKITQTGTKNGYWSIGEIYWTNDKLLASGIETVTSSDNDEIYVRGRVLYAGHNDGVAVFSLDGVKMFETTGEETIQLGGLGSGVYIVAVIKSGGIVVKKVLL